MSEAGGAAGAERGATGESQVRRRRSPFFRCQLGESWRLFACLSRRGAQFGFSRALKLSKNVTVVREERASVHGERPLTTGENSKRFALTALRRKVARLRM